MTQAIHPLGSVPECRQFEHTQRLANAAREFEGQMMKELLEPMTKGLAADNDDGTILGCGEVLTDFASEALGRALSDRGGIGIAKEVVKSLSHSGNLVPSRL